MERKMRAGSAANSDLRPAPKLLFGGIFASGEELRAKNRKSSFAARERHLFRERL